MRALGSLLAPIILLLVIVLVRAPATPEPEPVSPAAQPNVRLRSPLRDAQRGMELLRAHLSSLEEADNLQLDQPWAVNLPEAALGGRCVPADPPIDERPLLICEYGPAADPPAAQALFWREQGGWQSQLYPKPAEGVTAERGHLLRGRECAGGCPATVRRVRISQGQGGLELLVVADLGTPSTPMEEVHLLRMVAGTWRADWLPAPGDWNWGHARVQLPERGLTGFTVRSSSWGRQDRFSGYLSEPPEGEHRWFRERWVRKGNSFFLRDQVEEPGAYGTLVRLVYYISHKDDLRARELVGAEVPLAEAQAALWQRPVRQGWAVRRTGPATFALDRSGDGKPDLEVAFRQEDGRWLLSRLTPNLPDGSWSPPSPNSNAQ